ncbi:cold-shock protein [Chloroflexota bacterium]
MAKGTIKSVLDRGFGFIRTEEGTEIFFHRSELQNVTFETLRQGQEVEFEMGQGPDGRARATGVRLVETPEADDSAGGGDDAGDDAGEDAGDAE